MDNNEEMERVHGERRDEENEEEEDEEDEEEEEDDDDEEDAAIDGNDNGILDGGVAETDDIQTKLKRAGEADIVLFITCPERIPKYADHPILKPTVTVQIGLDKSTKLSFVFGRFVSFCNERRGPSTIVLKEDLEFVHSELLSPDNKPEDAALMKNDRITVRAESASARKAAKEMQEMQMEMDRSYFSELRSLMPAGKVGTKDCDVELDCQGAVLDETGAVQRVLATGLRCHSVIVSKRCAWLGSKISLARQEQDRRSVVTVVRTAESGSDVAMALDKKKPAAVVEQLKDENTSKPLNVNEIMIERRSEANQIENDDDDDDVEPDNREMDDASINSVRGEEESPDLLRVALPDFSPDAVRIMLEFLYTNRVVSLGYEAFINSIKTKPSGKHAKPVSPFKGGPQKWPKNGLPTTTFGTALAALQLAEEARLPRLSLMCEFAAAQLVDIVSVPDALHSCEAQKQGTGNELAHLRKAAMEIVLRSSPRGVYALPAFRNSLVERSKTIVPTLLNGTAEMMQRLEKQAPSTEVGMKRDWRAMATDYFGDMDYEDKYVREEERWKCRIMRINNDPSQGPLSADEERKLFERPKRKDDLRRRSIKRQLNSLGSRVMSRGGSYAPKRSSHRRGSR